MKKSILKLNGIQKLNTVEQKELVGGHIVNIDKARSHITWKCFRNNSGSTFFLSPVDLSSPTTSCYAYDNTYKAPTNGTNYGMGTPI
ncbi:hypothetical protein ACXIHB_00770 [Tenacibaculum sp. IMCC1]|uniref:Uncharacterized protein n=1 Tax=Tenacibaculum sp. Pbs-1 TaxID=3238748 RepID=A0AB33L090_9FLAO